MTAHGRRQSGFTIVELAIVIIVAGVLAVIAIPIYIQFVNDAKWSQGEAALMRVRAALDLYLNEGAPPLDGEIAGDEAETDGDPDDAEENEVGDEAGEGGDAAAAVGHRDLSQWLLKPATLWASAIGLPEDWADDLTYFKPEDIVLDVAPDGDVTNGEYRLRMNGSKTTSPKGTLNVTFDGEWTFDAP